MLCIGTSILYDDPLGDTLTISVAASTTLNGSTFNIFSQGTSNSGSRGGDLVLKTGSSTTNKSGKLTSLLGNYASAASLSIAEASLGARVVGLCLSQASMDDTLMPAGTGDNVIFIGNASSVPSTADPVGGVILYSQGGILKVRQSDGTDIIIGSGITSATSTIAFDDPGLGNPITFEIDATSIDDGGNLEFFAQNTTYGSALGGSIMLVGGDSATGLGGSIRLRAGNDLNYSIFAAETTAGKFNTGLALNDSVFDYTKMPANTGNGVIYIGNATAIPTSGSPVDGLILYVSAGQLYIKESGGTSYKVGGGDGASSPVLDANHVIAFDLDDASGTTTISNAGSGTAFSLTLTGTVAFEMPTPIGDGMTVTGATGYFTGTGAALTYQPSVTNFTAECWLEILAPFSVATSSSMFGKQNGGGGNATFGFHLDLSGSQFVMSAKTMTSVTGALTTQFAQINAWTRYYLVISYDGANVRTYINGIPATTTACTGTLSWDNAYSFLVGNVRTITNYLYFKKL